MRRRDLLYLPARAVWHFATHPKLWLIFPIFVLMLFGLLLLLFVILLMLLWMALFMVTIIPALIIAFFAVLIFNGNSGARVLDFWFNLFEEVGMGAFDWAFDRFDGAFGYIERALDWAVDEN